MLRQVAICSLPAPARRAAVAARMTAPGISGAPPTTSTRPRSSLSPSSSGCGSGQSRSNPAVMLRGRLATGPESGLRPPPRPLAFALPLRLLLRGDGDIRFRCDLSALLFERRDKVEVAERQLTALA